MRNFMKRRYIFWIVMMILTSCQVENLSDTINVPKSDFDDFNYVLATEDASDVDITSFFAFNLSQIDPFHSYDLLKDNQLFINSNPSTSSGHASVNQYVFSMAKDKKGYSSTPGLYRLTLNEENRMYIDNELHISRDNLFPARQICIVNAHLGYFYDEGKAPQSIQIFDPTEMVLKGVINLHDAIQSFRPDAKFVDVSGNNLIRTGSLVLDHKEGKLLVSVVFLEAANFNLIADSEKNFYLAVIDIATNQVEKIISYEGAKTVGFYVSENKATSADENGDLYFCSWGWNQFNAPSPSKIFRILHGQTEFDPNWVIDIEDLFGPGRIAQSMIVYNHKIYLHVSDESYQFADNATDDMLKTIKMSYYVFDPSQPENPQKLDIGSSNTSSRMNVFSILDDKLFICVPNYETGKFNGLYSIDRNGVMKKELTIDNKYRPTRLYKLHE